MIANKKTTIVSLSFFLLSLFTSCATYEEGPGFTLKSKKSRITGSWALQSLAFNEEPESIYGTEYQWEFEEDGDFSGRYSFEQEVIKLKGSWEFDDDKELIELLASYEIEGLSGVMDQTYSEMEILRLTDDELFVEQAEFGMKIRMEFKKQ